MIWALLRGLCSSAPMFRINPGKSTPSIEVRRSLEGICSGSAFLHRCLPFTQLSRAKARAPMQFDQ
jgi:hypothetical protein